VANACGLNINGLAGSVAADCTRAHIGLRRLRQDAASLAGPRAAGHGFVYGSKRVAVMDSAIVREGRFAATAQCPVQPGTLPHIRRRPWNILAE
jgi:hypothetical protein